MSSNERGFVCGSELTAAQCWYWVNKLRARFTVGDHAAALDAASRARPLSSRSIAIMQAADYHLYTALSHAACCNSVPAAQRAAHLEALVSHHRQLAYGAATCPENFADRAALVGAEVARLEGRELEAERLYARSSVRPGLTALSTMKPWRTSLHPTSMQAAASRTSLRCICRRP